jgi:hypothetical protein
MSEARAVFRWFYQPLPTDAKGLLNRLEIEKNVIVCREMSGAAGVEIHRESSLDVRRGIDCLRLHLPFVEQR